MASHEPANILGGRGLETLLFRRISVEVAVRRAKGEISDIFSGKTPYNRTTIFKERNGFFFARSLVFF